MSSTAQLCASVCIGYAFNEHTEMLLSLLPASGPNILSIVDVDLLPTTVGTGGMPKGPSKLIFAKLLF